MTADERRKALTDFIASARVVGSVCRSCCVGIIKANDAACPCCGVKVSRCERCKTEYTYTGETMDYCPACTPSDAYEEARKVFEKVRKP